MILATLSIFGQEDVKPTFNKAPLKDFADSVISQIDNKTLDLDKPFSITVEGYLTKDGRLDVKRTRITKSEGNRQMVEIAKQVVEAVSDSNILLYLQQLGVEKLKINLSQDEKNISATLTSEMLNENRAKTVVSGFNGLFLIARMNEKNEDTKILLNSTKYSSQSNNFILNFVLPKEEAHRMLKNELQKRKEKSYSN